MVVPLPPPPPRPRPRPLVSGAKESGAVAAGDETWVVAGARAGLCRIVRAGEVAGGWIGGGVGVGLGDSCFAVAVAEAGGGAGFRASIVTCLAGPKPALAFVLDFEGLEGNVEAGLPEAVGGAGAGGSGRLSRTKFPFLNSESRSLFFLPLPLAAEAPPPRPRPLLALSRLGCSSFESDDPAYRRTG